MTSAREFRPSELVRRLVDGGVDFVVVGGMAIVVQVQARYTDDLDICYSPTPENLAALGGVLVGLGARLRGVEDDDLLFVPDDRALRQTQILSLDTPLGGLDLLLAPEGAPPYPQLRERADVLEIAGATVRVASVDDMIAMKRAAGRPQDLLDLEALQIAKRRLGSRRGRARGAKPTARAPRRPRRARPR